MDAVAYALRAEYEGTTTVELEDGSTEERPTFGGGLLHVGDGDFDVAKALEEGEGTIVVRGNDQRLRDLLDSYPALKSTTVPKGAKPISPYTRQTAEALRLQGSMRDVPGAGSLSRAKLIKALEALDRAQERGDQDAVDAIQEGDDDVADDTINETGGDTTAGETAAGKGA